MDLLKQKNWFDSPQFEEEFHCTLPLGSFPSASGTIFRLWAPTAQQVTLSLYRNGSEGIAIQTVQLVRHAKGLWVYETEENLDGVYYDYQVTALGETYQTADPYARACGINGVRSMVIDLKRTDPEGWEEDIAPSHSSETVIYELHIKDFSWDPAGGFSPEDRGRYTALCRTGTTLNRDGLHTTGIDYIKRLGITHIHLMPIYDFATVDENAPDEQYNWGYDPLNYNVPEGSYSSDPYHGEVRIRELKQAIASLHRQGFRVIMDVVYNHTYYLKSWLWRTVPWYYYRQNPDGTAANGSGCGSELATERSMCAQYILDSILYWAEEYHIDGFRFDLMGLMNVELLNRIQNTLDEKYGKGEKLLYGEPWGASGHSARPGTVLCSKDHMKLLSPQIAAFCDSTRDAVKGSLFNENDRGFVNGGHISAGYVTACITGWSRRESDPFLAPSQNINYLSCHDDWTLWDKLVFTLNSSKNFQCRPWKVLRANRLAAAIGFSCQGYPFLLAGEEFGRTKNGVKNTYCSPAELNQLDWKRAWENHRLVNYYRGLITLRKKLICLQDKSPNASSRIVSSIDLAPGCVGITIDNRDGKSKWNKILLLFHAGNESQTIPLPSGTWQVLADDTSSFRWREHHIITDSVTLSPVSAFIAGQLSTP